MRLSLLFTAGVLIMGAVSLRAQSIHGMVTDYDDRPIDGVAVVLQTLDSIYVDAAVTDSLGSFSISQPVAKYRLLFQHLLYDSASKEISSYDAGVIRLIDRSYDVGEVTVTASRPLVKMEGGTFRYDLEPLLAGRAVTNAYEVLKDLPGVSESAADKTLRLAGASSLNVILNGQLTTLSPKQLQQLLKNIPASRVKSVEIMYVAPAKYNVNGAVINLLLSDVEAGSWQGEAGVDYEQHHYAKGLAHGNLLFSNRGLTLDLLLNGSRGNSRTAEDIWALHTLDGKQTEVDQSGKGKERETIGSLRLGLDYKSVADDRFSVVYYLQGMRSYNRNWAETIFSPLDYDESVASNSSFIKKRDHSALHNLHLQYDGHQDLSVGADYTHYKNPGNQYFIDKRADTIISELSNPTRQRVDKISLFANHTVGFGNGWKMNYGLSGDFSSSSNSIDYLYHHGNLRDYSETTNQKEYSASLFADLSKSFGDNLSASLALKGEYYKADHEMNGKSSTLWNEWALFPTLSLNYTISPHHILQFNLVSDKNYPPYWATSAQSSPLNSYSYIVGNPQLKPFRSYSAQLIYILMQRYTLVFFNSYCPDYFMQVPYQSDAEMRNVFRFENIDYSLQNGLQLNIPFSVKSFWRGNLSLTGIRRQERAKSFHSMSFNNKTFVGQVEFNNTFNLCSHPNLGLNIDALYLTPGMIQGLFEMSRVWSLSAGLKWSSPDERLSLVLKATDIFRSGVPDLHINNGTQRSNMYLYNDDSSLTLSLVWRFGGYKAKSHDSVDTSRFGK